MGGRDGGVDKASEPEGRTRRSPREDASLTPQGRNKNHGIAAGSGQTGHGAGPQHKAMVSTEVWTGRRHSPLPLGTLGGEAEGGAGLHLRTPTPP